MGLTMGNPSLVFYKFLWPPVSGLYATSDVASATPGERAHSIVSFRHSFRRQILINKEYTKLGKLVSKCRL
jgi:hypothetical protein